MSQENVDTIRRGYADLNRRDVEAWLDAFHANAEMHDLAAQQLFEARANHRVAVRMEHVPRGFAENLRRLRGPEQTGRGRIQEFDPRVPDQEDAVRRRLHQSAILISWQ